MEEETHRGRGLESIEDRRCSTRAHKRRFETHLSCLHIPLLSSVNLIFFNMIHHHFNLFNIYQSTLLHMTISTSYSSQSPLAHYKQTHPKSQVTQHTHNNANNSTLWSQRPDPPLLASENCSFKIYNVTLSR